MLVAVMENARVSMAACSPAIRAYHLSFPQLDQFGAERVVLGVFARQGGKTSYGPVCWKEVCESSIYAIEVASTH